MANKPNVKSKSKFKRVVASLLITAGIVTGGVLVYQNVGVVKEKVIKNTINKLINFFIIFTPLYYLKILVFYIIHCNVLFY